MSFHRYNSSRCCKLKLTYHFHFEFLFDLISDSVIFPQRKSMMGSAACADWVRKVAQLTQVCKESLSVNFDSYFQFIGEEECTIWMARELHVQEISINTFFRILTSQDKSWLVFLTNTQLMLSKFQRKVIIRK